MSDLNVLIAVFALFAFVIGLFIRWAYLAGRWNCYHCDRLNQPWSYICWHCGFEYREPTWR